MDRLPDGARFHDDTRDAGEARRKSFSSSDEGASFTSRCGLPCASRAVAPIDFRWMFRPTCVLASMRRYREGKGGAHRETSGGAGGVMQVHVALS